VSYSAEPPPRGPSAGRSGEPPQNIATAIAEVSERATDLVHEEIELAKAELSEKVAQYVRSAAIGAAAGVFVLMAVILGLVGCAWLLYYYLPGPTFAYFWGFFAMAAILVVIAAGAGMLAARLIKRAAPPVPTMAIDEARKIGETIRAGSEAGVPVGAPMSAVGGGGPSPGGAAGATGGAAGGAPGGPTGGAAPSEDGHGGGAA
jgi:hypothetical protein